MRYIADEGIVKITHTKPENTTVPPCKICKKVWQRRDTGKWVYHETVGVVCWIHHGVPEWYQEKLRELEEIINFNERGLTTGGPHSEEEDKYDQRRVCQTNFSKNGRGARSSKTPC